MMKVDLWNYPEHEHHLGFQSLLYKNTFDCFDVMANICRDYAVMTIWRRFITCKKAVTSTMPTHYCITILEWNTHHISSTQLVLSELVIAGPTYAN